MKAAQRSLCYVFYLAIYPKRFIKCCTPFFNKNNNVRNGTSQHKFSGKSLECIWGSKRRLPC